MTYGLDVSHYQDPKLTAQVLHDGGSFVIAKATEGTAYRDASHDQHIGAGRVAGAVVGSYHFAKNTAQAQAEASWFLANARYRPGDLCALDLEASDGGWGERLAYALTWLRLVKDVTGNPPLLYVNLSWWQGLHSAATRSQINELDSYPLWIATGGRPMGQPGITGWALHQWSTADGYDHDYLNPAMTLDDLTGADVALTADDAALVARYVWTGGPGGGADSYAKTFQAGLANTVQDAVTAAFKTLPAGQAADPSAVAAAVLAALKAAL